MKRVKSVEEKLNSSLKRIIENHLLLTWSTASTATIYNWLNNVLLDFDLHNLPNCNIRRKRKNEHRGTFKINPKIENKTNYIIIVP